MDAQKNRRRMVILTIVMGLCFVTLGCRLVDLQVLQHEEFARLAEDQHDHFYYREAPRGDILDRRGSPLATSVPVRRVCVDPLSLKGQETEIARFLAPLLKTNETWLRDMLSKTRVNATGEVVSARYVILKQRVPVEDWEKIRSALTNQFAVITHGKKLPKKQYGELRLAWSRAIYTEDDQVRTYPNGALAAHVLGFTGERTVVKNGRTNTLPAGVEGVEKNF